MRNEDEETATISDTNYFRRLRQSLRLPDMPGRPSGLPAGAEEPLWQAWNHWLANHGWQYSAVRGEGLYSRYIHYPMSQTLLRQADRDRLVRLIQGAARTIPSLRNKAWDEDLLFAWVESRMAAVGTQLREQLGTADPGLRLELATAIHEVYVAADLSATDPITSASLQRRRIDCGLCRVVDGITDDVTYRPLPKQNCLLVSGAIACIRDGRRYRLRNMKDGYYFPLPWPVRLGQGEVLEVEGDPIIDQLVVPERDFWILVADPDAGEGGMMANWERPKLSASFIVLARASLSDQMNQLGTEGMLAWADRVDVVGEEDWIEWRDCQILSPTWDALNPLHEALFASLRPARETVNVSLAGGVKGPVAGSWMENWPPAISVASFFDVSVTVREVSSGESAVVLTQSLHQPTTIALPVDLPAGLYEIETNVQGGFKQRRPMRIVAWCELGPGEMDLTIGTEHDGARLIGAVFVGADTSAGP